MTFNEWFQENRWLGALIMVSPAVLLNIFVVGGVIGWVVGVAIGYGLLYAVYKVQQG